MNHNNIYPIVVIALMAAFAYCTDDDNRNSDDPLVGLWEADVQGGEDFGYEANWQFKNDGSYDLDFSSVTFFGGVNGHSSGTYDLISDSILVVHSIDHENLSFNYAFSEEIDTLLVQVEDFRFTSKAVRLVGPSQYEIAGTTIEWERHVE